MKNNEMQPRSDDLAPLILHTEASRGWGGQEIRILAEMEGMRRRGLRTLLLAPEESGILSRARKASFPVIPVSYASKVDPGAWMKTWRTFRRLRPAVVNTHSSKDSWIAGAVARATGVPLIIRTRHVSTPIGSVFSYRLFPHLILTTSRAIGEGLAARGVDQDRILTLPTGIDFDRFRFDPGQREMIRRELHVAPSEILVGNICIMRSWKGLDFFIETAAALGEPFRFVLVGDGPQRERLQGRAGALGLENRILFPGFQDRVEGFFSALDIFFFTSYASEGIPQSLLQALGCGLPVVAGRNPSINEVLNALPYSWQVDYGDVKEAGRALGRAAKHLHRQRVLDDIKARGLLHRHALEGMWEQLLEIYRRHGIQKIDDNKNQG